MKILAIETSCDDTCAAVLEVTGKKYPRFNLLSNVISSQVEIHKKYGGIYPSLAKREHQRNLPTVLTQALKQAKFPVSKPPIDLIAVTNGPGLEPCLWVGVNFAKALACAWDLPIVPVNHIEAHVLANFVSENFSAYGGPAAGWQKIFPTVCLVVSGGHTQLILMRNFGKYKIIGETRDDAAGECFDKTARILGLGYPGGPAISAAAEMAGPARLRLPRPMIHQKNYDFSFSGLKTAVLYHHKKQSKKIRSSKKYIQEMSKEIQQAIIDVLIKKTIKAAKDFKVKSIILGGGVTANKELRKQLKQIANCELLIAKFLVPPKILCTDNAAMVGITGYFHKAQKIESIKAKANLRI